ncbi:lipoprotein signal peptidase [Prevotella communis]|uniref:lipoprotein signal peptidase n=1 Tax=Prevotella communis TaxID=2913614 RepID=UPI000B861212|nr:lipoprotein signal peptidase [Prevotella communis]UKK57788.1 lipoprotein signal peptidase [Prevotella communis]UKK60480.1 lipoprotein signal peptidase [Prevotella communis]UKK63203.1 lipoprotein signal peptidase [Prevotella communis]UKK66028.1 lipoprotein signal peptidase [Prevotella communis]UKK68458.1 lipoprotein signal peptidase [Prevotella communis]
MNKAKEIVTKGRLAVILIIAILLIDQFIKIWVKTHMELHESIRVTNWFYIAFIENNGMAYGMQIGSKLLLSLFRVVAIGALGYYIWLQSKKTNVRWGYIVCLSMILAGAAGNLIDCMFYGLCFDASTVGHVSQYVGLGNGYESFLMGRVVDMFYFPLIVTTYPDWFPVCGGEDFIFFSPVFNFADSSISVGVVALLLFFRKEIGQISFRKK